MFNNQIVSFYSTFTNTTSLTTVNTTVDNIHSITLRNQAFKMSTNITLIILSCTHKDNIN